MTDGVFSLLVDAHKSTKKGRYIESAAILEPVVITLKDSPYPLFLLAVNYLHLNRFSESDLILEKLRKSWPQYRHLIELDLFLKLKASTSIDEIVASYALAHASDRSSRKISSALRMLRKTDNFNDIQKNARLEDFVEIPGPPRVSASSKRHSSVSQRSYSSNKRHGKRIRRYAAITVTVLLAAAALSGLLYHFNINYSSSNSRPELELPDGIDGLELDGSPYSLISRVSREKTSEFYYSSGELGNDYKKARALIKNNKLNSSVLILNRIINSNASPAVKDKVLFLLKYISDIDVREYENLDYKEFSRKPYLFRGYAVVWPGRTANISRSAKGTSFSLLINAGKGGNFSGVADIYSSEVIQKIENNVSVKVSGVIVNPEGPSGRPYIVSRSVNLSE